MSLGKLYVLLKYRVCVDLLKLESSNGELFLLNITATAVGYGAKILFLHVKHYTFSFCFALLF
jgi:hypothetical protein